MIPWVRRPCFAWGSLRIGGALDPGRAGPWCMLVLLGGGMLAQQSSVEPPRPAPLGGSRPDVVVFLLDDVGRADMELVPTPAYDYLAARGTTFTRAYATPQCTTSRGALMAGTWQGRNYGLACSSPGPGRSTFDHGTATLPKIMAAAGYATALVGRWGLGTHPLAAPGTDEWRWAPHLAGYRDVLACVIDGVEGCMPVPGGYQHWLRLDNGILTETTQHHTDAVAEAAVQWWVEHEGEPRFLSLHTQAPHKGGSFDEWVVPPYGLLSPGYPVPASPDDRAAYEAMLNSADFVMARLLTVVDLSTTLVIYTSDNGTPREVHPPGIPASRVKFSTFEGGIGVPFVISGLGSSTVPFCSQPVSLTDVAATLAELVGGADVFDGQSLLPALFGEPLARPWAFAQKGPTDDCALVEERYKLRRSAAGADTFYDLVLDPAERAPLDPATPALQPVFARLRAELAQVRR